MCWGNSGCNVVVSALASGKAAYKRRWLDSCGKDCEMQAKSEEAIGTPVATPPVSVPKVALRALTELTGEPRFDVALHIALRDAVEHRLEKVNEAIRGYERKYEMHFEQFQARGQAENIPNQFSYEVESDYLEWDGLTSRKKKLEKILQWLI